MLKLINIQKDYLSGDDKVSALRGVNLSFRNNEFVSILGPSGCGKTTLLNLIGGLDHYTDGELLINGRSTRDYNDSDWDAYRNHSIGFVFQSYNLIPHQSVLANVELALTLSGVSKAERRRKAVAALERVGLKDQIKKRPNQLSGGQMQRVAIARALVNDPDILLADEPTGALDTVTSIQIMELLKEVASDRLVIMVTHNPELAEEYSTRIIRLLDGNIVDDSHPFDDTQAEVLPAKAEEKIPAKRKKPSMSLWTALSLSTNNLMTKKGRTILTSFAGSIGIIGIALILALSNGINAYINQVQEDTLAGYPITIEAESVDMSALMVTLMGMNQTSGGNRHEMDAVYSSSVMTEMVNALNSAQIQTNNLKLLKEFLDQNEEFREYVSNLHYSYKLDMTVLTKDVDGNLMESNVEEMMKTVFSKMGVSDSLMGSSSAMSFGSIELWQELVPTMDGTGISDLIYDQYELLDGSWPKEHNEVILVLNRNNELSDLMLCGLGLITTDEIVEEMLASQRGEQLDATVKSWSYDELYAKEFRIFLPTELYQKNPNGGYTLLTDLEHGKDFLFNNAEKGVTVKISGVVKPKADSDSTVINGALGYTTALTDYLLTRTLESELIREQEANPETDVILNLPFLPENFTDFSEAEKITMIRTYLSGLSTAEKAEISKDIFSTPSQEEIDAEVFKTLGQMTREQMEAFLMQYLSQQEQSGTDLSYIKDYIAQMSDAQLYQMLADGYAKQWAEQYRINALNQLSRIPAGELAALLDRSMDGFTDKQLLSFYEAYYPTSYSESTLEKNLSLLGKIEKSSPSRINIYTSTFENKDRIAEIIAEYNVGKSEEDQIEYTDYFAILMSSISTIINAIAYVLIAFVSISLVVSSIMIGIITYISVLERTKEIGILRAVGASKRDVSRVFTAESVIEGFAAGILGIGVTLILIIPINMIIRALTDIPTLGAELPAYGYLLILVSVALSFFAGLFPSKMAAKKDPVEALRTE